MATVLVADDDRDTRLLVRTVLEHAGHAVVEAENGSVALSVAERKRPDLILLDLSMPSMSGAEFMRALRVNPQTRSLAAALYTATPMNAAMRDFIEIYAMAGVVPKPSEPLELVSAVERLLQQTAEG
ncbi:MAG: response regulator [Candidatus Cybelea sp.]|jgi:two-component system chemotaxis response regulator CheY